MTTRPAWQQTAIDIYNQKQLEDDARHEQQRLDDCERYNARFRESLDALGVTPDERESGILDGAAIVSEVASSIRGAMTFPLDDALIPCALFGDVLFTPDGRGYGHTLALYRKHDACGRWISIGALDTERGDMKLLLGSALLVSWGDGDRYRSSSYHYCGEDEGDLNYIAPPPPAPPEPPPLLEPSSFIADPLSIDERIALALRRSPSSQRMVTTSMADTPTPEPEPREPTMTVSLGRKISDNNYGSIDAFISISGVRAGMTEEELEPLLETGKLAWAVLGAALVEKVREQREERAYDHR